MIKSARSKQKITQKEVALGCNLSQGYLSKLEKKTGGSYNPAIIQIINISKELNISPYKLAEWFIDKELNSQNEEFAEEWGDIFESGIIFKKISC